MICLKKTRVGKLIQLLQFIFYRPRCIGKFFENNSWTETVTPDLSSRTIVTIVLKNARS